MECQFRDRDPADHLSPTCWFDIGVREIVALKEKRFTRDLCKRISKAIAEIQRRRMAAAFAEIAIGLSCNSSLGFGDWLDNHLRLFDQIIETTAGNGITACVDNESSFEEVGGRNPPLSAALDRARRTLLLVRHEE